MNRKQGHAATNCVLLVALRYIILRSIYTCRNAGRVPVWVSCRLFLLLAFRALGSQRSTTSVSEHRHESKKSHARAASLMTSSSPFCFRDCNDSKIGRSAGLRDTVVGSSTSAASSPSASDPLCASAGRQGTGRIFAPSLLPSCPAAGPLGRRRRPTALAASHGAFHASTGRRLGAAGAWMGRRNVEGCGGKK